ncbi:glutathione S-transferase family protein [Paraburkholderia elongata]|uniref:Glutathione S-transferase family protein n=1 Tax=Paraburkholderia elongata TaxID=2675747 RepID=A0A972NLH1_9BURK|nr:glutathione S-transferase family protein [Paraburkholderia elongata]NPT55087.1 glutathione S-transferase family protein [Paraburkholderia elongata]
MGELIGGQWRTTGLETVISDGSLQRPPSVFRDWITVDGAPSGTERSFKAEANRYQLYVSLACPWAHRTLIMRSLKGLENVIGLSVVHWLMGDEGRTFAPGPGVVPDIVNHATRLHEIYTLADPDCTTRVSVPVIWDKVERTIVSNESSEITRMFNSAFEALGALPGDYYPVALRGEIDAVNARVYESLNNGVYRAGFAARQDVYEAAVTEVFDTLEWLEQRLQDRKYLVGGVLTEADIRVFTTLVRFDPVYYGHFKCNRQALKDYPRLWAHTRRLAQHPRIRPTINFEHIKCRYYGSHPWLNPNGIVPVGPDIDFDAAL